jgi:hydrophobic/amphiphilic exporter-1 (mainly G- bacteria), HAE1 family
MNEKNSTYIEKLLGTYFWWWVKNYKVSFMLIAILIVYWFFSLLKIPKESSPDIKFWIVQVSTVYPWANPIDIDSIITEKIYKEVKDIEGVDTIDTRSLLWVSNVTITLKNEVDTKDFINEVKTKVDRISFPEDVLDPNVSEISTDNQVLFQVIMYWKKEFFTMNSIRSLAMKFREDIINKWWIVDVTIDGIQDDNDFDIQVLLDKWKIESLWLTVWDITNQIRAYNQNLPLWSHDLGDLAYEYRISNDISSFQEIQNIPIIYAQWSANLLLGDIAVIQRKYKSDSVSLWWKWWVTDSYWVPITIFKANRSNIFNDAKSANEVIDKTLQWIEYQNIEVENTRDLSDVIIDDYKSLGSNAVSSILLVLAITALFIGLKQSIISTLWMIISFFITFIFLDLAGLTLNFLTNFSLILAFWAWIDTVIVFIEAAYENMKRGFNPKTAILMSVNTYKSANINSSLINIVVFIPLLVLPWITGKFLSYIPITIFTTLLWSLFLALTVNSALFIALNKKLPFYYKESDNNDWDDEVIMSDVENSILEEERKWKEIKNKDQEPFFEKRIDYFRTKYLDTLKYIIEKRSRRRVAVWSPIIALFATFIFLSPNIWFKLFPSGDNPFIDFTITWKEWTTTEAMYRVWWNIDKTISQIPEIKAYEIKFNNNIIDIGVILTKQDERKRDSFVIQEEVLKNLSYLKTQWYKVEWKVQAWWPPVGKAVGIDLVADNKDNLTTLKLVSRDFEDFVRSLTWTINVWNSSVEKPWQFNIIFDDQKLANLWLTPQDVKFEVYSMINWSKAWTVNIERVDRDIVVKYEIFEKNVTPETIANITLNTRVGKIPLNSIASIVPWQSLNAITRKEWDITITVDADLESGLTPTSFQPKLVEFANKYQFPSWISFKQAWENEANKDLIQSTIAAFFVSLFLAFAILVYQFNSFSKPAMVLYSIITALLWVNVWLWVTGNPYSMAFAIGFISLIWVVVNTSIFLVDRINHNIEKWVEIKRAIYEAWYARFKPIVISTLTTILWLWSVVTQDEFYASLWYTVIFGLVFSSAITLVAVPNLFFNIYNRKQKKEEKKQRKENEVATQQEA